MKINVLLTLIAISLAGTTYSQQPHCADSSIRIKYIFDSQGATVYNNPDTTGTNFFVGEFPSGFDGIALFRTNWGDSVFWAKKIYSNSRTMLLYNSIKSPNGEIICTGNWGGSVSYNPELMICKLDTNGNVRWIKRYKLTLNHFYYAQGNLITKNIVVINNAIYFTGRFYYTPSQTYNYYDVIAKLDLDGNIIWNKAFKVDYPRVTSISQIPSFSDNSVVFCSNGLEQPGGIFLRAYTILTRLNDSDGSEIESKAFSILNNDSLFLQASFTNMNPDSSISITGNLIKKDPLGNLGLTNIFYNTRIDKNLTFIHTYYYRNNVLLSPQGTYYDFNNKDQHAILANVNFSAYDKYLLTFDKDDKVSRSRKFVINSSASGINRASVNLDNKQNLHFIFHYPQTGKNAIEYARISNFSPTGSLGCFGKDTSILTTYAFALVKENFTWDNVYTNILTSNDVTYLQDTAFVTKQIICKTVSYCDSMEISGPPNACVGQAVRYSVKKNNGCYKNSDWVLDTALVDIVLTEGDSAIILKFKKTFSGYIHAAINDCVVKDSFFVTVTSSPNIYIVNRDSLLCPGKTNVLNAAQGFSPYLWQDGSASSSFTLNAPGLYKVSGISYCNVLSTDSLLVKYADTSLILPVIQTICKYDTAFFLLPNDVNNITWQPTVNSLLNNKTLMTFPVQNTVYTIMGERQPNCPVMATSNVVVESCSNDIFFPASFVPGGHNNVFQGLTFRPLQFYHLVIYNRYGQSIFETNNQGIGWDGSFKGKPQPLGGYIYRCDYRFIGIIQQSISGYFVLIR